MHVVGTPSCWPLLAIYRNLSDVIGTYRNFIGLLSDARRDDMDEVNTPIEQVDASVYFERAIGV